MQDLRTAAQIALGKFYLHPWDSQVLVDWARSQVQEGAEGQELVALSEMDRAEREDILEQFRNVVFYDKLDVDLHELPAITAYLENLRERVLNNLIEPRAAFAQVRPLAYDLEGLQLSGLSELDEDLNLLDSGEAPYHHPLLNAANRDVFIRTFFREMEILRPLPPVGRRTEPVPRHRSAYGPGSELDYRMIRWLEAFTIATIVALMVLYFLMLVAKMKGL